MTKISASPSIILRLVSWIGALKAQVSPKHLNEVFLGRFYDIDITTRGEAGNSCWPALVV